MDQVDGMLPSQESIDSLRTFLERPLNKPGDIAVFIDDVIRDYCGGIGELRTPVIEATTLRHEMGRIPGLVDSRSPMQRQQASPDHHHHEAHGDDRTVEDSLMYWQVETTEFVAELIGDGAPPPGSPSPKPFRSTGSPEPPSHRLPHVG